MIIYYIEAGEPYFEDFELFENFRLFRAFVGAENFEEIKHIELAFGKGKVLEQKK